MRVPDEVQQFHVVVQVEQGDMARSRRDRKSLREVICSRSPSKKKNEHAFRGGRGESDKPFLNEMHETWPAPSPSSLTRPSDSPIRTSNRTQDPFAKPTPSTSIAGDWASAVIAVAAAAAEAEADDEEEEEEGKIVERSKVWMQEPQ